jgi:ribosomal protein S18 acetylase RimI-like enzyme
VEVREASAADADSIGQLLHDFNVEYDEETPGPAAIARRMRELLGGGDAVVLLCGEGPDGLAVLRFRPSIWTAGDECYLAELYVKPELRGQGRGRALMEAVLATARTRGADYIDLNTEEDDTAARALYESAGFANTAYYYELDLRS